MPFHPQKKVKSVLVLSDFLENNVYTCGLAYLYYASFSADLHSMNNLSPNLKSLSLGRERYRTSDTAGVAGADREQASPKDPWRFGVWPSVMSFP